MMVSNREIVIWIIVYLAILAGEWAIWNSNQALAMMVAVGLAILGESQSTSP
jgi:hypothetical protein